MVVARLRGDAFLGRFSVVWAFATVVMLIVSFGMDRVLVRDIAKEPRAGAPLLAVAMRAQSLIWLVAAPGSLLVAIALDYDAGTRAALVALVPWVLAAGFFAVVSGYAEGAQRMDVSGWMLIVSAAQLLVLGTLALALGGGLVALALVMIWERATSAVFGLVLLRRTLGEPRRGRVAERPYDVRSLLAASAPFAGLLLLASLHQRVDVLMMPAFVSDSEVGQYAAAYRVYEAGLLIPATIAIAAFPVLVTTVRAAADRYRVVAGNSLRFSLAASGFLVAITYVAGGIAMRAAFGEGYEQAAGLLRILVWVLVIQSISNTIGRALIADHREGPLLVVAVVGLGANVSLNLALIPAYGAEGAAVATLVSFGASAAMQLGLTARYRIVPELSSSVPVLALLAVSTGAYVALSPLIAEEAAAAVATVLYLVGLARSGVVSLSDRRLRSGSPVA